MSIIRHNYYCMTSHMPDSGTLSKMPCANNELEMDTFDELDELKIDTFDKLDDLLRTAEKHDLAAFRNVNFNYDVNHNDPDIDGLELRTARFLGALSSCRHCSSTDTGQRASYFNAQSPRPAQPAVIGASSTKCCLCGGSLWNTSR